LTLNGPREIEIVVKGGYQPAVIRVRAGEPVRLRFRRLDADPCAGRVYFAEPPLSRALDSLATTTITITPQKVGTHLFTCEEGRYRGHLVVEPAEPRARRTAAEPSSQTSSAT
jgi:plastocyanin domain-containing protein